MDYTINCIRVPFSQGTIPGGTPAELGLARQFRSWIWSCFSRNWWRGSPKPIPAGCLWCWTWRRTEQQSPSNSEVHQHYHLQYSQYTDTWSCRSSRRTCWMLWKACYRRYSHSRASIFPPQSLSRISISRILSTCHVICHQKFQQLLCWWYRLSSII